MGHILDEIDQQIVALLQQDGRIANVEIARELGLAEGTIRKRLDRLLTSGAIRIMAVADPAKLGYPTCIFIGLQIDLAQAEATAERLVSIPEVRSVSLVTGAYDMIVEVILPSDQQLLSFLLDKVAAIPGVKRTETYHVLKMVKQACDWTVPTAPPTFPPSPTPEEAVLSSGDLIPGSIVLPS
jgi:Lrp/AsnC family transcriptional regulator for asnA, asnC and gidA